MLNISCETIQQTRFQIYDSTGRRVNISGGHQDCRTVSQRPGLLGMARTQETSCLGPVEDFWTTATGQKNPEEEKQVFRHRIWPWSWSCWPSGCCALLVSGPSPCSTTATVTGRKTRMFTWLSKLNTDSEGESWIFKLLHVLYFLPFKGLGSVSYILFKDVCVTV